MKLLIVSDIHGNWAALQSVLDGEADFDKILCLGDLVDYGPEPAACVTWAMHNATNRFLSRGITTGVLPLRKIREALLLFVV